MSKKQYPADLQAKFDKINLIKSGASTGDLLWFASSLLDQASKNYINYNDERANTVGGIKRYIDDLRYENKLAWANHVKAQERVSGSADIDNGVPDNGRVPSDRERKGNAVIDGQHVD